MVALGLHEEAIPNLKQAFELFVNARQIEEAVAVIDFPHNANLIRHLTDVLAHAKELVPTGTTQHSRVLASYALSLHAKHDGFEPSIAAINESIEIANLHNEIPLQVRALAIKANLEAFHGESA